MSAWQTTLILIGAVAAAVSGGAFFAFSNFVMPALARVPVAEGIRSMQAINVAAPNIAFGAAIVGAGPVAVPVLLSEFGQLGGRPVALLAAAIVASVASLVITMTLNVPRNNRLDAVDADTPEGAARWQDYLVTWTRANSARTLTSLVSVGCYALTLAP